jgi:membrane associated rhomboid family serine protease
MKRPLQELPSAGAQYCRPQDHRAWMTWLLTGSILAVWVWQLLGSRRGIDVVGTKLAFGPETMAAHHYWTLLIYAWAHALPLPRQPAYLGFHLVTNVFPLFCLGPALERWRGPWWFLALYLGGAVTSALVWSACGGTGGMIGASGAIFALFTAAGVLGVQLRKVDFVFFTLSIRLNLRVAALVLCGVEAAQMLMHQFPNVAHVAHLGGGLFGAFFALLARRVPEREKTGV